jgi:hypothetical protein
MLETEAADTPAAVQVPDDLVEEPVQVADAATPKRKRRSKSKKRRGSPPGRRVASDTLPPDVVFLLAGLAMRCGLEPLREAIATGGTVERLVWRSYGGSEQPQHGEES